MIRIGLRDVRAHLTRFITSIIAIALGVAFVVGAFCFRDILENQVSSMLSVDADGDVYVRGANKNEEKSQDNSSYSSMAGIEDYNKISESLTDIVKNVSGVDSVHAEQSFFTGVLVKERIRKGKTKLFWKKNLPRLPVFPSETRRHMFIPPVLKP